MAITPMAVVEMEAFLNMPRPSFPNPNGLTWSPTSPAIRKLATHFGNRRRAENTMGHPRKR